MVSIGVCSSPTHFLADKTDSRHVYTQNLWSFLDVTFAVIYWIYLIMRIHAWRLSSQNISQQALDVLAMGAPVLVPRLAFNLLSNNLLFVCLRAMVVDFTMLTALAAWCFGGFLLSLVWLGDAGHSVITVSKWMLWIWFGLDGTGIQKAPEFHWLLGPCLMVTFAFLGRHYHPNQTARWRENLPANSMLSRKHPLPDHSGIHALQHFQHHRLQRHCRDSVPSRRANPRGRQIGRDLCLPAALQHPGHVCPCATTVGRLTALVPQDPRLLCAPPEPAAAAHYCRCRASLAIVARRGRRRCAWRAQVGLVLGQVANHCTRRHSCRVRLAPAGRD